MRKEEFDIEISKIENIFEASKSIIGATSIIWNPLPEKLVDISSRFERGEPITSIELQEIQKNWISKDPLIDENGKPFVFYINDFSNSHWGKPSHVFHVSWCSVLERMQRGGREARYVRKSDLGNNNFAVDYGGKKIGTEHLPACTPCRDKMKAKIAPDRLYYSRENLDIAKFFEMYGRQDLKNLTNPVFPVDYPKDWVQISRSIRQNASWKCSSCYKDFTHDKGNLHVHHKNGVKGDVRPQNLVVLCEKCHAGQFGHGHMKNPANSSPSIHNITQKREEVFFDSTSKSQINKFDAFLREPEKYATGTWRAAQKIKDLREYFESTKHQLTNEKQKEFRHALGLYERKLK